MSTAVALRTSSPAGAAGRADAAIVRRAFRQLWVPATVWAVVFGGTAASSALTYVKSFPTLASRQQLAATTSHDTGLAVLLGPVSSVDTVGGYMVYKCFVFLTAIGAIWAILAATRLLRGEEDAGRWQLVLAGDTRPSRATAATLVALGAGTAVVFGVTTLIVLFTALDRDTGFGAGETVLYGASIAIAPAVFAAVGGLTSQLARTRRLATGLAMAVFAVTAVVRMIADSSRETKWLLWLTPFGWTERMRPFTENNGGPLVLAAVTVAGLCLAAIVLAARRDAGDGVLAGSDVSSLRPFGLRSPFGLAARLELPVLIAWCVGAAATALVFGIIAKLATGDVPSSLADTLEKFGVHGSFVKQYFGVALLLAATVVALLPASQVAAACDEETSGRLVHLLAQPVRRPAYLAGRLALAAAGIVVAGLLVGVMSWAGARTQGVDLEFGTMVAAGLNVVPTALVVLGIGAVVLSLAPRAAVGTVYAVVISSVIVDLFASIVSSLRWAGHVSLFHYMALAPAHSPEPTTMAITAAIGVALCVSATLLFDRRDVRAG